MTQSTFPSNYLPPEFDISTLKDPKDVQQLIAQRERLTATLLNIKEIAQYELVELISGKQYWSTTQFPRGVTKRYGYRTTIDLVALHGGVNIGAGATNLTLTAITVPVAPIGAITPLPSWGSATTVTGIWLFLNDPQVYVRLNPATNVITITNNYGSDLTQAYWVLEYLKTT
jgi:hypothetical protein